MTRCFSHISSKWTTNEIQNDDVKWLAKLMLSRAIEKEWECQQKLKNMLNISNLKIGISILKLQSMLIFNLFNSYTNSKSASNEFREEHFNHFQIVSELASSTWMNKRNEEGKKILYIYENHFTRQTLNAINDVMLTSEKKKRTNISSFCTILCWPNRDR